MPLFHWTDVRDAARGLARAPAVSTSAILCLGLGLGATTAISSAIDRALIEPLPLREPGRLVSMFRTAPQSNWWPSSAPNYTDLARGTRQLEALAAVSPISVLLTLPDRAAQLSAYRVTGNFFPMLGLRPVAGRLLTEADDTPDAPAVVAIGERVWQERFGSDPALVGRTIVLDGTPRTVVGIVPAGFRLPHGQAIIRADAWVPMRFTTDELSARSSNWLMTMGRLARGATVASANAELRGLFDDIVQSFPDLQGEQVRIVPLQSTGAAAVRTPLLLIFGAVGFVLLIAATNVASLLLARSVQRRRETAIRTAMGGSRWAVMRPVLAESLLLTGAGVGLGLALAWLGVRTIGRLAAASLPQLAGLSIDLRVIGFAVALSFLVALLCGALPAWRSSSVDPQDALRGGRGGGAGVTQHRALHTLVVSAVALSLVLLIGAGLVLKGFASLIRQDPGFDAASLLTMEVTVSPDQYPDNTSVQRFLEPALDAVRAVPGVAAAGAINLLPYYQWGWNFNVRYEGQPADNRTRLPLMEFRRVTPGFFQVTRQRLLAGRLLRQDDDERDEVPYNVVVNEATVRRDFPDRDPIGKRFYRGDNFATIVGVVSDIRNVGPYREPAPEMYSTYRQTGLGATQFTIVVRAARGDPVRIQRAVLAAIRGVDKGAAISRVMPETEVMAESVGQPKFYLSLLAAFAAVAVALALAGLYGVMSYTVAQRTREIGIRSALGSSTGQTVALVARQGLTLIGFGVVVGLAGGAALTRLLQSLLYGVSPADATTWTLATLALIVAGVAATLIPARRAARVDPLIAIRVE